MLFKKKSGVIDDKPIPYDIPATYGAEYDEYDYLYTKMPDDMSKWERYYSRCDTCGKYHWLNKVDTHYFYTMDGYDSLSYTECWCCKLKYKIHSIKYKIEKRSKQRKQYRKMIKMFTEDNIPITKELKEKTKEICR